MPSSYREHRPPAGLESMVACLWEHEATEGHRQRVVPDGCVDLVWLAERELLDALHDEDAAARELRRLAAFVPASGTMPVEGGAEGEAMRPLDFSPEPARPLRALLAGDVIAEALDALDAEQDADGGWDVDFAVYSPAAALEWRGEATIRALRTLQVNRRLGASA